MSGDHQQNPVLHQNPQGTAEDLVDLAVAQHLHFKRVARELETRPPSPEGTRRLLDAYRRGAAPAWLTAHLLGCLRDDAGYEPLREILLLAPGLLAESYAGPAMARIRRDAAFLDLRQLMFDAPKVAGREGAAYGLAHLGSQQAGDAILDAALAVRIRITTAASLLVRLRIEAAPVAALMDSTEGVRHLRLASEIVRNYVLLSPHDASARRWLEEARTSLCGPLQRVLDLPGFPMSPAKRRDLAGWIAGALRSGR